MANEKQRQKVTSLVCPTCGGSLKIDEAQEKAVCEYCGGEFDVDNMLDESEAVRVQKIKSQAYKDVETSKHELEREKFRHYAEKEKTATEKAEAYVYKKSKFSKITILLAVIMGISGFGVFSGNKIISGIICLASAIFLILSWLMGARVIKEKKRNLHVILAIIGIVLVPLSIYASKIHFGSKTNTTASYTSDSKIGMFKWDDILMKSAIPQPASEKGLVYQNTKEQLNLNVEQISPQQYEQYLSDCLTKGFNVEAEENGNKYTAFNAEGYKLNLDYMGYANTLNIKLKAPIKTENIQWPTSAIAGQIPKPESTVGKILKESSTEISAYLSDTTKEKYDAYVNKCMEMGFSLDYNRNDKEFSASNPSGYELKVNYEGNGLMYINISVDQETAAQAEAATRTAPTPEPVLDTAAQTAQEAPAAANGVSADFKATMDSYEQFFDEYIAFMKKYEDGGSPAGMLGDYLKYMAKYAETMTKFEAVDEDELSTADAAYYVEVQSRVTQKLLTAAQ